MIDHTLFRELWEQYLTGSLPAAGRKQLMQLLDRPEYREALQKYLEEAWTADRYAGKENPEKTRQFIEQLKEKLTALPAEAVQNEPAKPRRVSRLLRGAAAAAAVLLLLVSGYWLLFNRTGNEQPVTSVRQRFKNDVPPGGNKAVLTLANGKTIVLDRAHKGELARQGSSSVLKVDSGRIAYSPQSAVGNLQLAVQYNTLSTPRGGQYQLVLPDGSKVWLNAASSIRFPTAFRGKNRTVEITGEAYFEIVKDAARPFFVKFSSRSGEGREGVIQVLGTRFNVNAYADEAAMKVTLLQGSVKVARGKAAAMLQPGEQAVLRPVILRQAQDDVRQAQDDVRQARPDDPAGRAQDDYKISVIKDAAVNEAVAWKNGYFEFSNASIESIMRQVARWYDVDIHYTGKIPQRFTGKVPRDVNVSTMFRILEATGWVHFEIGGREVIVKP